jgi:hypothetical protein
MSEIEAIIIFGTLIIGAMAGIISGIISNCLGYDVFSWKRWGLCFVLWFVFFSVYAVLVGTLGLMT